MHPAVPNKSAEYIIQHSKIYGRNPKSTQVTDYQRRINDASKELCLSNPSLLENRKFLLEKAREKVDELGYAYKKGKSRSKRLNPYDGNTTPKRRKIGGEYRLNRITEVTERIKDVTDQLGYKEKRREAASNIRDYKECDRLTEQMSVLKSEKRQLEFELSSLTKKQKKSLWYQKRKRASLDNELLDSSSCTPSPVSSRLTSPSPVGSCVTSPSPMTVVVRRNFTPSDRFSSPLSPAGSESEYTNDGDTVIVSSEEDPDVNSRLSIEAREQPQPPVSLTSPQSFRRCEQIPNHTHPMYDVESAADTSPSAPHFQ